MTHSTPNDNPEVPTDTVEHGLNTYRDGSEGTEPILVKESDRTPYQLWSTPRWNKDIGLVENVYEVFNTTTRVVESRARINYVTAVGIFESLEGMYVDLEEAGSVRALDEKQEAQFDEFAGGVSAKTH